MRTFLAYSKTLVRSCASGPYWTLCLRNQLGPCPISDGIRELPRRLGSSDSKHVSLRSLQFRFELRCLSAQSIGSFFNSLADASPAKPVFHINRPAGGRLDNLYTLGRGPNGLSVTNLIIHNRRSGRHLVRCQVFVIFALLNLAGFYRRPARRSKGSIMLLDSSAMPPQAPATNDGNHQH